MTPTTPTGPLSEVLETKQLPAHAPQETSDPTLVLDPAEPTPHWEPRDPHVATELERAIAHAINVLSWDTRLNAPDFHLAQDLHEHVERKLQAMHDVEAVRRVITNPEVRNMLTLSASDVPRETIDRVLDAVNQLMDLW